MRSIQVLSDQDPIRPYSLESMFAFNDSDFMDIDPNEKSIEQKRDYSLEFSVERELTKNHNLITNLDNNHYLYHTTKTNLLLERVDLYKLKDIIDSLESLK